MTQAEVLLSLFSGFGIELEYMVVDRDSMNVLPVTDEILRSVAGEYVNEIEEGPIGWSNELVLHVIELKTNGPIPRLEEAPDLFLTDIHRVNRILAEHGGMLLPTAMHPWMNPDLETRLWPHGSNEIYATYDRIFDCRGHGWANLQSMHLNLPFAGDAEFARLHAAIRVLLPVLPALSASSPIVQWEYTGLMDTRLDVYRHNARRIPCITGQVVPEPAISREDYATRILAPMYEAIAPLDPDGILQHEWLNSRGAIARFDRNAIEIRILDTQESPQADLAIAQAVAAVLKELTAEHWSDSAHMNELETGELAKIFLDVVATADDTVLRSRDYLRLFDFPERTARAADLWQYLLESTPDTGSAASGWKAVIGFILREGCLARRIVRAVGPDCRRSHVREAYRTLAQNLADGTLFEGIG